MRTPLAMRQFMAHGPRYILIGIERMIRGMPQSEMNPMHGIPITRTLCEIVSENAIGHSSCFSPPLSTGIFGMHVIESIFATAHFSDRSENILAFFDNELEFGVYSSEEGSGMLVAFKIWNVLNLEVGGRRGTCGCRGWIVCCINTVYCMDFSTPLRSSFTDI